MKSGQTLEQRRRNAVFAKKQESRMGKSEADINKKVQEKAKPSVSPVFIALLAFVIIGGLIFELIAMFT
ncbi:hypothetical protein CFIMG_003850RA [Ceratocystis fimbriata CBS 114723]|uniref:Stress-associated endoplasmic reticulum protein n=1 Tax=Ceratocystis fimbriata CBS 114723 TaxID=1035309 RepID=A0A2C5XKX2_9PEZI|nr:hypothetical protein CFIMG_003850RA [Ceratocystis fimbriata CBS 114723]